MTDEDRTDFNPLLVVICSFGKNPGGTQGYYPNGSGPASLDDQDRHALLDRRHLVYDQFADGTILWDHSDEREHMYNEHLVCGPDLGGTDTSAVYMPAVDRYDGRFYMGLDKGSRDRLSDPGMRTLIISGLYGLLEPNEQVQCYSIPVEWGNNVQETWCRDDLLTRLLLVYIRRHGVTHIYDFTAREDYRSMIDWLRVRDEAGIPVRHCFSRDAAGEDALKLLGIFIGKLEPGQVADGLRAIPIDRHPKETGLPVYARTIPYEYEGLPTERKPIPPDSGLFFWEIVPDTEARRIFETGEKVLRTLISSPADLGDDQGSILFMNYGKGLEVLLNNTWGKRIASVVRKGAYTGNDSFISILRVGEDTVALGAWIYLEQQSMKGNNPVERAARQLFESEMAAQYPAIRRACTVIAPYRNKADHRVITSMEEMFAVRREIVNSLNQVLFAIYGEPVQIDYNRRALRHGTTEQRQMAVTTLAKAGDIESVPRLVDLLDDTVVGPTAARALGMLGDGRAAPALERIAATTTDLRQKTARDAIASIEARRGQTT